MTEEQKQILKNANVPEELWNSCYFVDSSSFFAPKCDLKTGEIIKTGEEQYKIHLNSSIPLTSQPSQDEILRAKIIKDGVTMQLQLTQQQKINANLVSQIAGLSAQILKLTGGTK